MRILLVGEYSRLHNSLKEGLVELGNEVFIMAGGDGFKKYPVDIDVSHSYNSWVLKKLKVLIYKLFKIDLGAIEIYRKASKALSNQPNFDVVQLINEFPIKTTPTLELKFLKKIINKTEKLYLLSCGVDYTCMDYMMKGIPKYSLMSSYLNNPKLYNIYKFQLQYLSPSFKEVHDFILHNCNGVISSDFDYHLPYLRTNNIKYLGLIPNPINIDKIKYIPLTISGKIKIFHGINTTAVHKKGNEYFSEALDLLKQKYKDKVEVIETKDLPYEKYINIYNECHILLDQVYGYDQGYNALEAMAKGKVVFSGAEQEWLDYYQVKENTILINVLPNANQIYNHLEFLVLNPNKIIEISKNAREFIKKEHHYMEISKKYLNKYISN